MSTKATIAYHAILHRACHETAHLEEVEQAQVFREVAADLYRMAGETDARRTPDNATSVTGEK